MEDVLLRNFEEEEQTEDAEAGKENNRVQQRTARR